MQSLVLLSALYRSEPLATWLIVSVLNALSEKASRTCFIDTRKHCFDDFLLYNYLSSICLEIQQCRRQSMTLLCTGAFSLRLSQVDWNLDTTFERLFDVSARFSLVRYSVKDIVQITSVRKTIRKLGPNLEWVNCTAVLLKMPLKLIIYNRILDK